MTHGPPFFNQSSALVGNSSMALWQHTTFLKQADCTGREPGRTSWQTETLPTVLFPHPDQARKVAQVTYVNRGTGGTKASKTTTLVWINECRLDPVNTPHSPTCRSCVLASLLHNSGTCIFRILVFTSWIHQSDISVWKLQDLVLDHVTRSTSYNGQSIY